MRAKKVSPLRSSVVTSTALPFAAGAWTRRLSRGSVASASELRALKPPRGSRSKPRPSVLPLSICGCTWRAGIAQRQVEARHRGGVGERQRPARAGAASTSVSTTVRALAGVERIDAQLVVVAERRLQQAGVDAAPGDVLEHLLGARLLHRHRVAHLAVDVEREAAHHLAGAERELELAFEHPRVRVEEFHLHPGLGDAGGDLDVDPAATAAAPAARRRRRRSAGGRQPPGGGATSCGRGWASAPVVVATSPAMRVRIAVRRVVRANMVVGLSPEGEGARRIGLAVWNVRPDRSG